MAYDLMLLTRDPLTETAAAALHAEVRAALGPAVAEPVSTWDDDWNADPEMAVDELLDGIDGEAIDPEEYRAFCRKHRLPDRVDDPDPEAAARYLGSQAGFPLLTFTLPEDRAAAEAAFAAACAFAKARDLVLHDPQMLDDVDLARAGALPGKFGG